MKKLSGLLLAVGLLLGLAAPAAAQVGCSFAYVPGTPPPAVYAPPWDVLTSPNPPQLVSVDCTQAATPLTVGTQSLGTQYIYKNAFVSTDGVTWTPIVLTPTGGNIDNNWFQTSATANLSLSLSQLVSGVSVEFLVATKQGNGWAMGGCLVPQLLPPPTGCSPKWSVQSFSRSGPFITPAPSATSTIQAVNYDFGGQGVGFNATQSTDCPNTGYRPDEINLKLESTTHILGCSHTAQWFRYTVVFPSSGSYTIVDNVATSVSGASYNVLIDGVQAATIAVPNTGSFTTFADANSTAFSATSGQHVVQFTCVGDSVLNDCADVFTWHAVPVSSTLVAGTYSISNSGSAVDWGFDSGPPPFVDLFTAFSPPDTGQQWVWNGTTFAANDGGNHHNASGPYLADNGDGTATVNNAADVWNVVSAGGITYTLQDTVTGRWLRNNAGSLAVDTVTPHTVWSLNPITNVISNVSISSNNFIVPATGGALVGNLTPTMASGSFNGGTAVLSTTSTCGGTASTDNGSFQILGSSPNFSVNVGPGGLTAAQNYNICVALTPVGGSVFFKPLTLTGGSQVASVACPTTPPAEAQAAGFTTLAMCLDFTSPIPNNVGMGLSTNWAGCGGGGTQIFWIFDGACSNIQQISDPQNPGHQVMQLNYLVSQYNFQGNGSVRLYIQMDDGTSLQTGTGQYNVWPMASLWEYTYRDNMGTITGDACTGADSIDIWSWSHEGGGGNPPRSAYEIDFNENVAGNGTSCAQFSPASVIHNWTGTCSQCNSYIWQNAGGIISSSANYHTYGTLVTTDGTSIEACGYIDHILNTASGGCNPFPGGDPTSCRAPFTFNQSDCPGQRSYWRIWVAEIGGSPPPVADNYMWLQSLRVWTCPQWNTGGDPRFSNPGVNTCFGNIVNH